MNAKTQTGAVLLFALVILLVLTLLGVSGMQGSLLQERMASAQRDGLVALEVAESGMREVEGLLDGLADLDPFGNSTGYFQTGDAPDIFDDNTWDDGNGLSAEASEISDLAPRYFVEHLGKVKLNAEGELPRDLGAYGSSETAEFEYARIVVMAQGRSGQSRRILEGFYVFKPGAAAGAGAGAGG